jgi:hypothetical protein
LPKFQLPLQVDVSLQIKIGSKFRTIIKYDEIEWCSLLKNINRLIKTNRFAKAAYKDVKEMAPAILDPCPFIGEFKLINVASPENVLSILPPADFIGKIRIKDNVQKCDAMGEWRFSKYN